MDDSILVVGEPGAGKSGVIKCLTDKFKEQKQPFLYFAVDKQKASSLGGLRDELGLEHEVMEVLKNWPVDSGVVIIDALDTARSPQTQQVFLDLIKLVNQSDNWTVVASIRKFDLRYNQSLKELFEGSPILEFADNDYMSTRHINVPALTDDEISGISKKHNEFGLLLNSIDDDLKRNIFNIRLLEKLFRSGNSSTNLSSVQSQADLLDRFWQERVINSDGNYDAREAIIEKAVKCMIDEQNLQVNRKKLTIGTLDSQALNELLSLGILVEWKASSNAEPDRYTLTFAHNVMFDYAAFCTTLRGSDKSFVKLLEKNPKLSLLIRPSYVFYWQHTWRTKNKRSVWNLVEDIWQKKNVFSLAKIVAPAILANLIDKTKDIEPLVEDLESVDPKKQKAALEIFNHILKSKFAFPDDGKPLVGNNAGPWTKVIEKLSETNQKRAIYMALNFAFILSKRFDDLTHEQITALGRASRSVLSFILKENPVHTFALQKAIYPVCRTFGSEAKESKKILQKLMTPSAIAEFGYITIFRLGNDLKHIDAIDPEFVYDIFKASFEYKEERKDETPLNQSGVQPLVSNKKQDYEGGIRNICKYYPVFLKNNLLLGLKIALMVAGNSKKDWDDHREQIEWKFDVFNQTAQIKSDNSSSWGDRRYTNDIYRDILNVFENYIEELCQASDNSALEIILKEIIINNSLAVFWRILIKHGTEYHKY